MTDHYPAPWETHQAPGSGRWVVRAANGRVIASDLDEETARLVAAMPIFEGLYNEWRAAVQRNGYISVKIKTDNDVIEYRPYLEVVPA